MEATCINLRKRFGRDYKIEYETPLEGKATAEIRSDPWMQRIPCRFGHIYPHGGNVLAVFIDGHPNVAAGVRRLACCRVKTVGDFGELTALFDVADFDQVAQIVQPRRRRRLNLTPEQRVEIGRRLRGAQHAAQVVLQSHPTGQGSLPGAQVDPEVLPGQLALFST